MLSRPPGVIARGWRRRPPGPTFLGTRSRDNEQDRPDWPRMVTRHLSSPAQSAYELTPRPPNGAKLIPAGSDRPPLLRKARRARSDIQADRAGWSPYRRLNGAVVQRHHALSAR